MASIPTVTLYFTDVYCIYFYVAFYTCASYPSSHVCAFPPPTSTLTTLLPPSIHGDMRI